MNAAEQAAWDGVRAFLEGADSIAFDGCHKIYIHKDAAGTASAHKNGYGDGSTKSELIMVRKNVDITLGHVLSWFEESCFLRFVNGITGDGNDNADYVRLIEQGAEEEWEKSEKECSCEDEDYGDEPCEKHD